MKWIYKSSQQKNGNKRDHGKWIYGTINKIVGSGENAKHSIVTITIICAFTSILIVTILVVINYWCFRDCENKVPDIIGDLKNIWEIVTPIITLALGYEFGKSEK